MFSIADSHHIFVLRWILTRMHTVWWKFLTLSLGSSMSLPWSLTVMLLDCCIINYHSRIFMKYCFAFTWHIFPIIRCKICTRCLHMLYWFSWINPVLLCTPLQTDYLLFLWWSHPCWNWYWWLAPRFLCLIWPEFTMPLRHCCLNRIYYLCDWWRTQLLSCNMMLDWLIPRKINNNPLSYL